MHKRPINFQFHGFIQPIIVAIALGSPIPAAAQLWAAKPTIVFVSMDEQTDYPLGPEAEERIKDELRLSNFHVVAVESKPFSELNEYAQLKQAAETHDAQASMLAYKTDFDNVRLLLFTINPNDDSQNYKEYNFPLRYTDDETDIAAFKVAEVVQIAIANDPPAPSPAVTNEPPAPFAPPRKARPPRSKKFKIALTFALTGAATLGLGAVLHSRKLHYENEANNISDEMWEYRDAGLPDNVEDLRHRFNTQDKKEGAFRASTIVAYSLGSALVTACLAVILLKKEKKETNQVLALSLQGTNMTLEF